MQNIYLLILPLCLLFNSEYCFSQEQVLYKRIDSTELFLEKYNPEQFDSSRTYPAMIFFFGGGWNGGKREQFLYHAKYFSKRGMVCFLADYRTKNQNNTSPFESLKDAKSAIRFIRKNTSGFGIDPAMIVASGGSAGGHLAAATALIEDYDESTDDLSISCIPNALVLFNPVIDNGPGGYGYERIGDEYKKFSPLHNIKKGAPPTIIFLGTDDRHIPVETARYYKMVMNKVESRCDLKLYEGAKHGFFNHKHPDYYQTTILEADEFLQSLGILQRNLEINKN